MLEIYKYEDKIKEICEKLHIKKLAVFGSATTDKFGPESDIDIIIEFYYEQNENLFDKYFMLKEELTNIFHRPIDIIVERSVKNPFLKQTIDSTKRNIYAA